MRGKYLLLNNEFVSSDQWDETSINVIVVYEVLRIIEGIPLFFEDHYQRLINSCRMIGQLYEPDKKELYLQIVELAKINAFTTGNITIKLIFNHSVSQSFSLSVPQSFSNSASQSFSNSVSQSFSNSASQSFSNSASQSLAPPIYASLQFSPSVFQSISPSVFIYFISHSYPTDEDYRNGVKVGFLEVERNNPEAKVEQGMKEKVSQSGQENDVYEVLLVDKDGFITEGSRSNMVFVKGDALYTCPLNRVLKGITLAKVLEIALVENIPVIFEAVPRLEISSYDALFITGTSPKILPVSNAGDTMFDINNPLMRKLMRQYDQLMELEIIKARVR